MSYKSALAAPKLQPGLSATVRTTRELHHIPLAREKVQISGSKCRCEVEKRFKMTVRDCLSPLVVSLPDASELAIEEG